MNTVLVNKLCKSCNVVKPVSNYSYNKSGTKLKRHCRDCEIKAVPRYEFDGIPGLKLCRSCNFIKFTTAFNRNTRRTARRNKHGYTTKYSTYCTVCSRLASESRKLIWRKNRTPAQIEHAAHHRRFKTYGLSKEAFVELFGSQGGRCAVCRVPALETVRGLYVDHCHKTDSIRGLLCHNCNTGIGQLGDDSGSVERAVKYLANFEGKRFYPVSINRFVLFKNKR